MGKSNTTDRLLAQSIRDRLRGVGEVDRASEPNLLAAYECWRITTPQEPRDWELLPRLLNTKARTKAYSEIGV